MALNQTPAPRLRPNLRERIARQSFADGRGNNLPSAFRGGGRGRAKDTGVVQGPTREDLEAAQAQAETERQAAETAQKNVSEKIAAASRSGSLAERQRVLSGTASNPTESARKTFRQLGGNQFQDAVILESEKRKREEEAPKNIERQITAKEMEAPFIESIKPIVSKIDKVVQNVQEFFVPPSAEEEVIQKRSERLITSIDKFNYRYGGRVLEGQEYIDAERIKEALDRESNYLKKRTELINNEKRTSIPIFIGSAFAGAASSPLVGFRDTLGFLGAPVTTTKNFLESIKELPSQVRSQPAAVLGNIVGSTAASFIVPEGKSLSLRKTSTRAISGEVSVGEAVRVGTDPVTGRGIYNVRTQVETLRVTPSGKIVDRINTQGNSIAQVLADSESGAVNMVSDTIAASTRRGGRTVSQEAITLKADVSAASGEGRVNPTSTENLFFGNVKSVTSPIGVVRFRAPLDAESITRTVVRNNLNPQSTVLSNIQILKLLEGPSERLYFGRSITGNQQVSLIRSVSDVYRDTVRVRGYRRIGQRVNPTLRTIDSATRSGSNYEVGISRSFSPADNTDIGLTVGKQGKSPKSPSVSQILSTDSEMLGAQVIAKTQTAAIAKSIIEPKFYRPIIQRVIETDKYPLIVGGTSRESSAFTGMGIYEQTQEPLLFTGKASSSIGIVRELQPPVLKSDEPSRLTLGKAGRSKSVERQVQPIGFRENMKPIQIESQATKQSQKTRLLERFREGLQFARSQSSQALQPTQPRARSEFFRPTSEKKSIARSESFEKLAKAYDVFIKQKGKKVKIAEALPLGLATQTGVRRNLSDISASFTLEEVGTTRKRDSTGFIPSSLFRKSKRSKNTFVQIEGTRLRGFGERRDIQRARKRKRGFF